MEWKRYCQELHGSLEDVDIAHAVSCSTEQAGRVSEENDCAKLLCFPVRKLQDEACLRDTVEKNRRGGGNVFLSLVWVCLCVQGGAL